MSEQPPSAVKIARARVHLDEFWRRSSAYTDSLEYQTEREGGDLVVRVSFPGAAAPPVELSAVVGDVLHNARSAVDCATYEVAVLGGDDVSELDALKLQAPLGRTPSTWADRRWRNLEPEVVSRLDGALEGLLHDHQDAVTCPEPLCRLARLSNVDKHRRLHLTVAVPHHVTVGPILDREPEGPVVFTAVSLAHGGVAARVKWVDGRQPSAPVDVLAALSLVDGDRLVGDMRTLDRTPAYGVLADTVDAAEAAAQAIRSSAGLPSPSEPPA